MKKNIFTFATAIVASLLITTSVVAQQYEVKTESSNINWVGKKVTGEHSGTIGVKSGSFSKGRKGMTANFEIDMTSIKCTDMEGEYADKLVGHLNSGDFFNVEEHQTASFVLRRIAENVNRELGTTHTIYGQLTIKGIKKDVNFPASILIERGMLTASGKLVIDRTDYDIKYKSGKFFDSLGDKMIYDEFELDINIVAQEATTKDYNAKKKNKRNTTNKK